MRGVGDARGLGTEAGGTEGVGYWRIAEVVVVRVSCSLGAIVPATSNRISTGRDLRTSLRGLKRSGVGEV